MNGAVKEVFFFRKSITWANGLPVLSRSIKYWVLRMPIHFEGARSKNQCLDDQCNDK
ncbi:hypothetical protein IMPERIA89_590081 [Imperialibacter sp. 89]|nr:hypothetical protein IMPERIA89_590081 [Imperialibacter sp. 89]